MMVATLATHSLTHKSVLFSYFCRSLVILMRVGLTDVARVTRSFLARQLSPGSSWALNTCSTWGTVGGVLPDHKGGEWRGIGSLLTVITGSGMSAYGESGHTYTRTLTPKCLPWLVTRANWSLTSCSSQSSLRLCDMLKRSWIKVKKTSVLISFDLDIGCLIYDLKRVSYPSKNSEPYLIWRRMW